MPEVWAPNGTARATDRHSAPVAQLLDVSKGYGLVRALDRLTLEVRPGEVVALLGPNGAGKTTAISVLLGLRTPDAGTALLFGRDPRDRRARVFVGSTPQETDFPGLLTVREILDLIRPHYPSPMRTDEALARFGLGDLAGRQVGGLSGGQRRGLALAAAFVGNPRAVFLDEPTTGMDAEGRARAWEVIREHAPRGGSVLLTTHYMEEAEALATRVVAISAGKVATEGTVQEIRNRVRLKCVRLRAGALPSLTGVAVGERRGDVHTLYTSDADALVRELVQSGVPFSELELRPTELGDALNTLGEGDE